MARRRTYRQKISAIILLMVMMLQVGVKTLHQHHHAESQHIVCSDCEHHRVHGGHLLSCDGDSDDCELCQLLATPFTENPVAELVLPSPYYHNAYFIRDYIVADGCNCTHYLRGPPSLLL